MGEGDQGCGNQDRIGCFSAEGGRSIGDGHARVLLHREIVNVVQTADVRKRLAAIRFDPSQYGGKVIKDAGIRIEWRRRGRK
jgi:hypothetical protein